MILLSLDTSSLIAMGLVFLCSVQSKDKLITAFPMMESESSFHGLEMMMAARNPGVVGFRFNLHALQKENFLFIVEMSQQWKSSIKHTQVSHGDGFSIASSPPSQRPVLSGVKRLHVAPCNP